MFKGDLEVGKRYVVSIEVKNPLYGWTASFEEAIWESLLGLRFTDGDVAVYLGKDAGGHDQWKAAATEDSGNDLEFTTQWYNVTVMGTPESGTITTIPGVNAGKAVVTDDSGKVIGMQG